MRKFRPFFLPAILVLLLFTCQLSARAAEPTAVTNFTQFEAALNDPTVTHIMLQNSFTEDKRPDGDIALFIPARANGATLVIEGASPSVELNLQHSGIILLGNTTFKNLTFYLSSSIRNAIIANGYTLTMEDIHQKASAAHTTAYTMALFAGSVSDYSSGNIGQLTSTGSHGQIILKGHVEVAEVFAGSLSDLGDHTKIPDKSNSFDHPVTIRLEPGVTGEIGIIYGSGAREDRSGGHANDWLTGPTPGSSGTAYKVTGEVNIYLNSSVIRHIDGNTQSGGYLHNARVFYSDSNRNDHLTVQNLNRLVVQSGYLKPTADSSFTSASVAEGSVLDLSAITSEFSPNTVSFTDFTGGGSIALRENQTLSVVSAVTGSSTSVGIGGIFLDSSEEPAAVNHAYVIAGEGSAQEAFHLLPYSSGNEVFTMETADGQCAWAVREAVAKTVLIKSISIPKEIVIPSDAVEIYIPFTVEYDSSSTGDMAFVPLNINEPYGTPMKGSFDPGTGYEFTGSLNYKPHTAFCSFDENGSEALCLQADAGFYEGVLEIAIPAKYMADNTYKKLTVTLKKAPEELPAQTAVTGFTINGQADPSSVPTGQLQLSLSLTLAVEHRVPQALILAAYTQQGQLVTAVTRELTSALDRPQSLSFTLDNTRRNMHHFRVMLLERESSAPLTGALDPMT